MEENKKMGMLLVIVLTIIGIAGIAVVYQDYIAPVKVVKETLKCWSEGSYRYPKAFYWAEEDKHLYDYIQNVIKYKIIKIEKGYQPVITAELTGKDGKIKYYKFHLKKTPKGWKISFLE